ncbi:hypothetical protein IIA16_00920 [bacterium]|nr:hypothetical protein [bacterium]
MRLAWPLLVLALAATGSPAEGFDAVWGRAILWQVGDNVAVVAAAREEIIAMGEDAVPLVMARLGAASTLELRALRAVVPAIGEPFVEPLLEVVKNGEGQRLATAIELLRRLEAPAVMDVVAARWPGGLPDGAAGREAMAAAAAFGRVDMVSTIAGALAGCDRDGVAAAQALGGLEDAASGAALAAAATGPCPLTRYAAVAALGRLGRLEWLPHSGRARARALGLMDGGRARRALRQMLADDDWRVRLDVALALRPESVSDRTAARRARRGEEHPAVAYRLDSVLAG